MSQQPPPEQEQPSGWTPPAGWSDEQPGAWGTPPPAAGPPSWSPGSAPPSQGQPQYGQPQYGQPQSGQPGPPPPQYGQPQYGQPQYGQPQYGQPQYGQPQYGQPQYGQPQYGQPQYGQPQYGQPQYGQPQYGGYPAWTPPPQAPKPGIVPLRPLGVGELLDGALSLIRSNPKTVLGLAAAISALSALVQGVGSYLVLQALGLTTLSPETATTTAELEAQLNDLMAAGVAQLLPALVAGFLQVLASGLFIVLVGAAVLGRRLDASATWTLLRPRLLSLIGVTVLLMILAAVAVGLLVGIAALLVYGLGPWGIGLGVLAFLLGLVAMTYAYVRLAVASPALVMEALSPVRSLGRSWSLVRGSWWRVLGILVLSAVIVYLLTAVITVPFTLMAAVFGAASSPLLPTLLASGMATLVSGIVTLPFTAAVTGLLYTDLRIRREALDIQLINAGVDPHGDPLAAYRRS